MESPVQYLFRRKSQARALLLGVLISASASGSEAVATVGLRCTIEHAILVSFDGETHAIPDAPAEFDLEHAVSKAPLVRDPPLRELDYYEERPTFPHLAIDKALFAAQTDNLRSDDGVVYVQSDVVLRLLDDGRFVATGLARTDEGPSVSAAVYMGKCSPGR
jgi:hypothetical protein